MIGVIDGHNDLAWASREKRGYRVDELDGHLDGFHTDIPRLRAGGVTAQFWSLWVDPVLQGAEQVTATLEQIDFVHRLVAAYPRDFVFARTAHDVREATASARIGCLMGAEGGDQIDGSLATLRSYARMGVRYMTLTWSQTTPWADSATDIPRHGGLSGFGQQVVAEMNRIGMVVDLAHVAPTTMRDALDCSALPVMVSHSCASALSNHPRNVPDDVISRIGSDGGVVMVAFVRGFVSQDARDWYGDGKQDPAPAVTASQVADHMDHIREVAGIEAVGIGADFDGTDTVPDDLPDVSHYQELLDELSRRGWSYADLEAAAHGNVLRVLEANDDAHRAFLAGDAPEPPRTALVPRVDANDRPESH